MSFIAICWCKVFSARASDHWLNIQPCLLDCISEAIQIANGTPYGLVGGVFTRDLDRATSAARQLRAGQVFVNEWYAGGVETPFGGFGKSGYGREKGREALWNYVQTKNVAIKLQG